MDVSFKEFADQSPCLCFQLRKASRAITQVYDQMLRTTGLTACQMMILNVLSQIGALTVTALAEAMATDRTTITRNLQPLQRKGWVKLQKGKDRRSRLVGLTAAGSKAVRRTEPIFRDFQKKLHAHLSEARLQTLCQELAQTISTIQQFSL